MGKKLTILRLTLLLIPLLSQNLTAEVLRDVKYDTKHERNVLDFWPPKDATKKETQAAPVYIFFHGGGFRNGDKSSLERNRKDSLQRYREAGYAVVSCNYPFLGKDMDYESIAHHCARAIQFVRSQSKAWKIDPKRVVCGGVSAGALISEFLGYHDDFANPASEDPVEKLSSRAQLVVSIMQPIGTEQFAIRFMEKGEAPLFIYSNASPNDRIHPPRQAILIRDKARKLGIPVEAYGSGRNELPRTKDWLKAQLAFCEKHLNK